MLEVLIVENDPRIAQLYLSFLNEQPDFKAVGLAYGLTDAHSQLSILQPDLILLNTQLPDGIGLALLDAIRAMGLMTEVIVITAANSPQGVLQTVQAGVFDFLLQPLAFARLQQALTRFKAYRAGAEQLQVAANTPAVDQAYIDQLLRLRQQREVELTTPCDSLPKGIDANTLELVREHFGAHPHTAYNSLDTGRLLGLCRTTARRYLEYLVSLQELSINQVYGSVGRPERKYILARN